MGPLLRLALVLAVLCTDRVTAKHKEDLAPFTSSEASNVYQYFHRFSCPHDQSIFIRYLQNGYKRGKCQCEKDRHCCQRANNDCLQDMSPDIFQQATLECWGKSECRLLVTKPKDSCQKDGVEFQWPTYSEAVYWCVPGNAVVDMTKQALVSGDEVIVRAFPAYLPHSHTVTCSVQPVNGGQRKVVVYVYAVLNQGAPPLARLSVESRTLSSQGHRYSYFLALAPFNISLQQPAHSSLHYAWVGLEGDDVKVRVSCGQGETTPPSTAPGAGSQWTRPTNAVTRKPLTSENSDSTTSTSVPVSSGSGGRQQLQSGMKDTLLPGTEAARGNTETSGTFHTDAKATYLVTTRSNEGGTSASVPVSSSGAGREQQESAGPMTNLVIGLAAGLVVVLLASCVFFFLFWRQRQRTRRARHGSQPGRGGHIVLAELAADVTCKSMRSGEGYQNMAVLWRGGVPPDAVTSDGQDDHDYCTIDDFIGKDRNDCSRVEREGQVMEEAPYDVIEPFYVNKDVD